MQMKLIFIHMLIRLSGINFLGVDRRFRGNQTTARIVQAGDDDLMTYGHMSHF